MATDEKSNEITAIPELLEMIDIAGAIITADAISRPKKIVDKIIEKQVDYVMGLKGNQGTLLEDVSFCLTREKEQVERLDMPIEKGHGRIEKCSYSLATIINWLPI